MSSRVVEKSWLMEETPDLNPDWLSMNNSNILLKISLSYILAQIGNRVIVF